MWVDIMTLDENGDVLKDYSLMAETLQYALSMIQKWADAYNCTYHYYVHEAAEWEAFKGFAYDKGDRRSHLYLSHNMAVISQGVIRPRR